MFLKKAKAKGNYYFYLCSYDSGSPSNVKLTYKFGRKEVAAMKLRKWINGEFPSELIDAGCSVEDFKRWIDKIEEVS